MSASSRVDAVATAHHIYDGRPLRPGDPFECSESELADLRVLGFAQAAPVQPVIEEEEVVVPEEAVPLVLESKEAAFYDTRVLTAEESSKEGLQRVKRKYTRRDLRAEE